MDNSADNTKEAVNSAELAAEWCSRNNWNPDIIPVLANEIANSLPIEVKDQRGGNGAGVKRAAPVSESRLGEDNTAMLKCLCGWKVIDGKGQMWFPSSDCPIPDHNEIA